VQVHHPEIESFSLAPQGFIQPHRHALELYRTEISKQLKSLLKHPLLEPLLAKGNWTAWDLYCGAGAFSDLPSKAAGNNRAVTTWCIEGIAAAVSATKKNHPGLTGQAIADDVREFIAARIRANDLPEIVVCDPPRDGIGAPTTRALATALSKKASPSVVVWIACDMASFARDTKPFLDSTFELFSLSLFDCFTHTTHAEIIGIFWHAGQMQKQGHHH
jgi:tRNA/tmRNA/rRNA uracil-C5-methylase (TrmA/RlmC/RlmD family)